MAARFAPVILAALVLLGCSERRSARLDVDFSRQGEWTYGLHVEIDGALATPDSTQRFSNDARCRLSGHAPDSDRAALAFSIRDVAIASNVMSDAEITNLTEQFEGSGMVFSCYDGDVVPVDSTSFPVIRIGEWDLYRTLARLIPSVPRGRVRVGASWDRERQIPLKTALGETRAHLYQLFRLDSLTTGANGDTEAHVGWTFSYRVEQPSSTPAELANDIPLMGKGTGHALFNTSTKRLESAHVTFSVPKAQESKVGVTWNEKVDLVLAD